MQMQWQHIKRIIGGSFIAVVFIGLFLAAPVRSASDNTVVIQMTASIVKRENGKFIGGWDPKRIEVKQGQKVILEIKSVDATHVFFLDGYGIQSGDINPGKPVEISFTADKAGIFYYSCHMECGPYHQKMVGQLVVDAK